MDRHPCSKCGKSKLPESFYRDRSRKSGLDVWCKACVKTHQAVRRTEEAVVRRVEKAVGAALLGLRRQPRPRRTKLCRTCGVRKPIQDKDGVNFWKNSCNEDGLRDECKDCFYGWRRQAARRS